jgi:hypothetical protein
MKNWLKLCRENVTKSHYEAVTGGSIFTEQDGALWDVFAYFADGVGDIEW